MKTLFIHNALPEYRLEFMKKLSDKTNIDFLITDPQLANKIYKIKSQENTLNKIYFNNKKEVFKIKKIISRGNYNTIILPPADSIYQFLCSYLALKEARKRNLKIFYWSEKWEANTKAQPSLKRLKNWIQALMIRYIARRVHYCIVAGSCTKKYFEERIKISEDKIKIAYDSSSSPSPNSPTPSLRQKYKIPNNAKIVLYIGRVIPRKGCDLLISSIKPIIDKNRSVYLIIGGEGPYLNHCKKLVDEKYLKNIVFIGKVLPEERGKYYQEATVFVLPSYSLGGVIEAWGLTVNEALEQGTPVIATTAVGAAHDLLDNKCGIMIPERSINDLNKAINYFINDKISHELITSYCKNQYKKFSVENMVNQFYEALIN